MSSTSIPVPSAPSMVLYGGPTAEQIGYTFIKTYYDTLTRDAEKLYKFYKDDSSVTHGEDENCGSNVSLVSGLEVCSVVELQKKKQKFFE